MKKSMFVAGLVLVASSVQASPINWTPTIAIAAGRTADTISSIRFSSNGSGCTEATSMFRRTDGSFHAPKAWMMTGAFVAGSIGLSAVAKRGPKWLKTSAQFLQYASAGLSVKSTVRNVINCGW